MSKLEPNSILSAIDAIREMQSRLDFSKSFGTSFPISASQSFIHSPDVSKLRGEIAKLESDLSEQLKFGEEKKIENEKLSKDIATLKSKQELLYILSRTHPRAEQTIINNLSFREKFLSGNRTLCAVMSIDIRQSTQLMLNAKTDTGYAAFISELCQGMVAIVKSNFGIFDKFTGDGVLSFFPDFYSGHDALYYCLRAARDAHSLFIDHYAKNQHHFDVVKDDIGLGIGIDYGEATLTSINDDLTVVGKPVVYACRLSSAPCNATYVNQSARNELMSKYPAHIDIDNRILDIKHQDRIRIYSVHIRDNSYEPALPDWMQPLGIDSTESNH